MYCNFFITVKLARNQTALGAFMQYVYSFITKAFRRFDEDQSFAANSCQGAVGNVPLFTAGGVCVDTHLYELTGAEIFSTFMYQGAQQYSLVASAQAAGLAGNNSLRSAEKASARVD